MKRRLSTRRTRTALPRKVSRNCGPFVEKIVLHVERHLGPIAAVLRGSESRGMRIDLLWVPPDADRGFHTIVTCGMSGRPMTIPDATCVCGQYVELVLRLPRAWPVGPDVPKDEAHRWPLDELIRRLHDDLRAIVFLENARDLHRLPFILGHRIEPLFDQP